MSFQSIKTIFDAGSNVYQFILKPLYEWASMTGTSTKNHGPDQEELKKRSANIHSSGLQLMQKKNYFEAKLKFEEALSIYPANDNAKRSIYVVNEKIKKQKILKTTMLCISITTVVILILWVAITFLR